MILTDKSIKGLALVRNEDGTDEHCKSASYDLTVGTIITPDGSTDKEDYALPPQGILKVISKERVVLPANVTAYVHVKTALCNEGVLSLNIGIVDPCWDGPLQRTLINFGKVPHRIHKGSVFGRITFHRHRSPQAAKPSGTTAQIAERAAQDDVDKVLGKDFLDFSRTVKEAAKEATSEYRNILLWFVPGLALLLAIFTYFLNFANMHRLEGYISIKDRAAETAEIQELKDTMKQLQEQLSRAQEPRERPAEVSLPARVEDRAPRK
jgi:deoxycytidine triphosphate deaminase